MQPAAFVSCDIVGHSAVRDPAVQRARISDINRLVREVLERHGQTYWASGGDGGHTILCGDDWGGTAIDHLRALRDWAHAGDVPLRIIAHRGDVDRIEGADGRVQFVGDGINFAGRLLEAAPAGVILVSQAFQAALRERQSGDIRCDEGRVIHLRNFGPQRVSVLSLPGDAAVPWYGLGAGDRELLQHAQRHGTAWDVLYYAKRIMQANAGDDLAEQAVESLGPHQLVYRESDPDESGQVHWTVSPFLGALDPEMRVAMVRAAQLIERPQGTVLCEAGDDGDSLFVVLRGSIGVFRRNSSEPVRGEDDLAPVAVIDAGEVAGELAFALRRSRTARLVAVEDAALLSCNASSMLCLPGGRGELDSTLEKFLASRILEYVCHNSEWLLGSSGSGPLSGAGLKHPWERMLRHAERIVWPLGDPAPVTLRDSRFQQDGVYVLVGGSLRSLAHPEKVLRGSQLPVVYVDLPGWIASADHAYRVEGSDATLLRIGKEAFLGRKPVIDGVTGALKRSLAGSGYFHFDVFLSYTFDDQEIAERWRAAMEAGGLRVYMEVSRSGHYFRERIEAGILDSLTLVALVSAHTMSRPLEQNWVRQEIAFRQAAFEQRTARIFPVRLRGGRPELLADGYTVLDAVDRDAQAQQEVLAAVTAAKRGDLEPPFARERKADVHLGG